MMVLGVVLIVAGVGSLFVNVLPFHHREEVAEIGAFTATHDKETDVYVPPYSGIIVIALGGLLVGVGLKRA